MVEETTKDRAAGEVVILADYVGTVLFAVTAGLAAIIFTTPFQWIAAITALLLFAIGVFSFLWAYYNAVVRSRRDEISVLGLYLLVGRTHAVAGAAADARRAAGADRDRRHHDVHPPRRPRR